MKAKNYFSLTGTIFAIIFAIHLLRVIKGWEVVVTGWTVPMWFSWLGVLLAGYLAFAGMKLRK